MKNVLNQKLPYRELKFLFSFLLLYGVFQWLYFMIPWHIMRDLIYHHGIVSISADIINFFANEQIVTANENKLSSPRGVLVIVRGCDGSGSLFLLSAAIIAFSASIKHKLFGLGISFLLLYVINQVRIIGLYFVVVYQRDLFLTIHTYFAPTLIIVISGLFFAWWTYRYTVNNPSTSSA